ncbi:MAG: iron chaperone [Dysgonomonas sp.]
MTEDRKIASSIDEYISGFPKEVQFLMHEIRSTIKKAAPQATEKISWAMPTFYLNGNIAHFAAHKKHIGFYPGAEAIENFKEELLTYKTSKGAIQFPLDKPLPLDLVTKIIKYNISK